MPSREETYRLGRTIVEQSLTQYPGSERLRNAWGGIYQALLWYEALEPGVYLPHIIDTNRLRARRGRENIWRQRAARFEEFLAEQFGCGPHEVRERVDRLMRSAEFQGLQRQNPLGTAFIGIVQYLFETYGDSSVNYRSEFPATELFPAISLPGRSTAPKVDLAAFRRQQLIAIISTKWSLRHDRMGDLISECRAYKAAAVWTSQFKYVVVTNEFDAARLLKAVQDECFDMVVHVHREAVVEVCGLDGRLSNLRDLPELVQVSFNW